MILLYCTTNCVGKWCGWPGATPAIWAGHELPPVPPWRLLLSARNQFRQARVCVDALQDSSWHSPSFHAASAPSFNPTLPLPPLRPLAVRPQTPYYINQVPVDHMTRPLRLLLMVPRLTKRTLKPAIPLNHLSAFGLGWSTLPTVDFVDEGRQAS